jgi:hypothetical protein
MRTSAPKISPLYARIEKEISRQIDRAPRARNFIPIARSRRTALEAITLDLKFSDCSVISPHHQVYEHSFGAIEKNIFDRTEIIEQSR